MKSPAALSPAVTEFDILVDLRLVEIDRVTAIPLCLGQQRAELRDKRLPPLGIGPPQQPPGLLPRQLKSVQGGADRRAAADTAEALSHPSDQAPECPAWLRISPGYRGTGRFLLGCTDFFAERGLDVGAKGGRPPVR
jgi:hypothetical protein